MKVLLINPTSLHSGGTHIPDVGLGYLATALRKDQHEVGIIQGREKEGADILRRLLEFQPDVVGIKVISLEIKAARRVIEWTRAKFPGATVVLGGPHISIVPPDNAMDYFKPDFCIRGEGEISFPRLLDTLIKKSDSLDHISGLVYRKNGKIWVNPVSIHENLEDFDYPSWDLIDPRNYPDGWYFWSPEFPRAPVLTSRGCPYRCTFCAQNVVGGKRLRVRPIDNVLQEIEMLMTNYQVFHFDIIDDNFLMKREYVEKFCRNILENGWKIRWNCCGARLDILDPPLVRLMDQAGCNIISIGFESGSQRVLDYMKKDLDLQFVRNQVKMISRNSSIKIFGLFIIGFPTESEAEIRQTIRHSLEMPLFMANFSTFMILPGCEETQKLQASGEIKEIPWDQLGLDCHIYAPKGISLKRLKYLYNLALFRFYARPVIFFRIMRYSWRRIPWFIEHVKYKFTWRPRKTTLAANP